MTRSRGDLQKSLTIPWESNVYTDKTDDAEWRLTDTELYSGIFICFP